jgi:hypothetical protein
MPGFGIASDTVRGRQNFKQEGIAKAGSLCLIPTDGVIKLAFSDVEEANRRGRYLAAISLMSFADRSPRR